MKKQDCHALLILAMTFFGSSAAHADGDESVAKSNCNADSKIADCYESHMKPMRLAAQPLTSADILEAQGVPMGGLDTAGSDSATTSKSFRERFSAVVENVGLDEQTGAVVLSWNTNFLKQVKGDLQLKTIIRTPSIHSNVEAAIPESSRTARKAILEKRLNDLDDTSFAISYAPQNCLFGRSYEANAGTFKEWAERAERLMNDADDAFAKLEDENSKLFNKFSDEDQDDLTFEMLVAGDTDHLKAACDAGCKKEAQTIAEKYDEVLSRLSKAESATSAAFRNGLPWVFGAMLQNQPQLTLTYQYDSRNELAGPGESTIGVTYERGYPSLNTVRAKLPKTPADVERYHKRLKRGYRLTLTGEYGSSPAIDFTIPASEGFPDALAVEFEKVTSKKVTASFSMALTYDEAEKPTSSLAFTYKYIDVSNNEKQRDQGLGVLTYTARVNETLDFPLALVYANHSRYLDDNDKAISAHLALRYRLKKR